MSPIHIDPDTAAQRLADVGWHDDDGDGTLEAYGIEGLDDSSPFMVELGTTSLNQLTAQIVQQNLQAVGIAVEINVVDFNVYQSEYLTAVGIQPPTPSWGNMVAEGGDLLRHAWWVRVFQGAFLFLCTMSFNLVGDGLRDALDPHFDS